MIAAAWASMNYNCLGTRRWTPQQN